MALEDPPTRHHVAYFSDDPPLIFKVIYMKNHIYHLKDLKKLYKGHLNGGTYRFLIGNSENIYSKYKKMHKKMRFS